MTSSRSSVDRKSAKTAASSSRWDSLFAGRRSQSLDEAEEEEEEEVKEREEAEREQAFDRMSE